jgi:hypothetical protein
LINEPNKLKRFLNWRNFKKEYNLYSTNFLLTLYYIVSDMHSYPQDSKRLYKSLSKTLAIAYSCLQEVRRKALTSIDRNSATGVISWDVSSSVHFCYFILRIQIKSQLLVQSITARAWILIWIRCMNVCGRFIFCIACMQWKKSWKTYIYT